MYNWLCIYIYHEGKKPGSLRASKRPESTHSGQRASNSDQGREELKAIRRALAAVRCSVAALRLAESRTFSLHDIHICISHMIETIFYIMHLLINFLPRKSAVARKWNTGPLFPRGGRGKPRGRKGKPRGGRGKRPGTRPSPTRKEQKTKLRIQRYKSCLREGGVGSPLFYIFHWFFEKKNTIFGKPLTPAPWGWAKPNLYVLEIVFIKHILFYLGTYLLLLRRSGEDRVVYQ